ncbi:MAG: glycosyltransferase family 4 protein, partial [Chloroflexus sp.]|nr:glycosyltransferase family 4 protein [Chloroflexus sp.]
MNTLPLYGVEYILLEPIPDSLWQDEPLLIGLQLRNTGLTPWLVSGYPVLVVIRWFDRQGNMVIELPWRALPHLVPANESTTIELRIDQTPPPGEYVLTIELVEHQVAWFRDKGVPPFSHPIRVKPPQGPRITVINGNCIANDAVGTHVIAQVQALTEAGFRPLLLTEFIDDRIPRSLRRFMVAVHLEDILHPNDQIQQFAEHLHQSAVIIVNYSTYYKLVELIRYVQAPVLFDYHGITPPEIWGVGQPGYENLVLGVANRNLVQFADYAVAHSRYMVDELVATDLIAASRVSVLPYPALHNIGYSEQPNRQLQEQYGLIDKRVLLYVGRMARNKRIHILVEALPFIHRHYPNTVLLLVGETGHVYAGYVAEIKARAAEIGVAESVIFTGPQNRENIADFYRLADIFVTASIHEGFCMPVIEAMALGKPVIAAAATALPDTVGDAGLLFTPDDPVDLAQKVIQMLQEQTVGMVTAQAQPSTITPWQPDQPIAFVTPRYGHDVLGGAERGAQAWAEQLVARGFRVEVLTTNAVDLASWQTAQLPATEVMNGVLVRRFVADPIHPSGFHEIQIKAAHGKKITRRDEEHFMVHNLRSRALEDYIARHREDYAAFIFTPYLFGTSYYGAQQAGDRAFHIPCLHDEPAARFSIFREMLEEARGIFFNTPAEEQLAREKLKVANPFTAVLGYGFPDQPLHGDPDRFRKRTGIDTPFLLYSGRLETAKNVPLLIEWFLAYKQDRPESNLVLVLAGKGDITVPDRSDIVKLGMIVDRQELADAYAATLALCQLSLNESFSIVMMEAWQQRRPVIVHADCAVTREHVERSGGGYACHDAASFITAIDTLLERPEEAAMLGERGYTYVQKHFTWSVLVDKFVRTLSTFLQPRSMIATFAQRGIRRALDFTYDRFESHLISLIQRMCEQYGDWKLLEEVHSKLSALRQDYTLSGDYNGDRNPTVGHSLREWLKWLRSETKVSSPIDRQQTSDVTIQLIEELFNLLIQTRNNYRRLEREQARLHDRLL